MDTWVDKHMHSEVKYAMIRTTICLNLAHLKQKLNITKWDINSTGLTATDVPNTMEYIIW